MVFFLSYLWTGRKLCTPLVFEISHSSHIHLEESASHLFFFIIVTYVKSVSISLFSSLRIHYYCTWIFARISSILLSIWLYAPTAVKHTQNGQTALDIVKQKGYAELEALLEDWVGSYFTTPLQGVTLHGVRMSKISFFAWNGDIKNLAIEGRCLNAFHRRRAPADLSVASSLSDLLEHYISGRISFAFYPLELCLFHM